MASLIDNRARRDTSQKTPDGRLAWPLVLFCIGVLSLGGWAYLAAMIADMVPAMDMSETGPGMGVFNAFNLFAGLPAEARAALAVLCLPAGATFGMPGADLTHADLAKIFVMWAMMALAMMLPTAIPMLRAYFTQVAEKTGAPAAAGFAVFLATAGYLTIWLGYAVVATGVQWMLSKAGALTDMMAPASLALTASVLIAAGLYQFTPAKQACLTRCWYPRWAFPAGPFKPGPAAAFREGLVQGRVCFGCCWAVMTVMFAVGLMNILWIALLGGVMALEKTFPSRVFPAVIGAGLLLWGGTLAALMLTGYLPV